MSLCGRLSKWMRIYFLEKSTLENESLSLGGWQIQYVKKIWYLGKERKLPLASA